MRQLCAVTFTFASYYSFIIKKYRQCLIWLFVAYLFHTSAVGGIIPIAIYYVANVEAKKKEKNTCNYLSFGIGSGFSGF